MLFDFWRQISGTSGHRALGRDAAGITNPDGARKMKKKMFLRYIFPVNISQTKGVLFHIFGYPLYLFVIVVPTVSLRFVRFSQFLCFLFRNRDIFALLSILLSLYHPSIIALLPLHNPSVFLLLLDIHLSPKRTYSLFFQKELILSTIPIVIILSTVLISLD